MDFLQEAVGGGSIFEKYVRKTILLSDNQAFHGRQFKQILKTYFFSVVKGYQHHGAEDPE